MDFDFVPSSLGFVEGLEEAFIASSSWMNGCARESFAHFDDIVLEEVLI